MIVVEINYNTADVLVYVYFPHKSILPATNIGAFGKYEQKSWRIIALFVSPLDIKDKILLTGVRYQNQSFWKPVVPIMWQLV